MQSSDINKKIKIIELTPTMLIGGAENVLRSICQCIDRKQFELTVVSMHQSKEGSWPKDIEYKSLKKNKKGFQLKIILQLSKILRKEKPDVIHNHFIFHLIYLIPANLMSARCPIVQTIHTDLDHYFGQQFWKIIFFTFKIRPVNLSPSLNLKIQRLNRNINIPNGVDIARFSKITARAKNRRKILFIGRFEKEKNPLLALRIFEKIQSQDKSFSLTMIGTGSLEKQILEFVRNLKLKNVTIINKKVNPEKYFQTHDYLISTSRWEGMPLILIEAMSAGLVVFSTAVGAISNIIQDNKNGFLFKEPSIEKMAARFLKMSCDSKKIDSIIKAAQIRAQQLSDKEMVQRYQHLFKLESKSQNTKNQIK